MLHEPGQMTSTSCNIHRCCMKNLVIFKFELTCCNMSQHMATWWPNARNMLHPIMLRYVVLKCCDHLAGGALGSREESCLCLYNCLVIRSYCDAIWSVISGEWGGQETESQLAVLCTVSYFLLCINSCSSLLCSHIFSINVPYTWSVLWLSKGVTVYDGSHRLANKTNKQAKEV